MANTLTLEQALNGLEKAVEERGGDYTYMDHYDFCKYAMAESDRGEEAGKVGEARCVLGAVFRDAGFDLLTLDRVVTTSHGTYNLNGAGVTELVRQQWLDADGVTVDVLEAAQDHQDAGGTWGGALEAARAVVDAAGVTAEGRG